MGYLGNKNGIIGGTMDDDEKIEALEDAGLDLFDFDIY